MRYHSPQGQLTILYVYTVLLTCIPELLNPCSTSLLSYKNVKEYSGTWKEQIAVCMSALLGILGTNILGPRILLLFGNITTIIYSSSILVAHKYGDYNYYLAGQILYDMGRTAATVCVLTMTLTYPREQRKARVLALLLFLVDLCLTLGQVLKLGKDTNHRQRNYNAACVQLTFTCVAILLIPLIAPIGKVVRDNGVYLLARQSSVAFEARMTVSMFRSKWILLLVPYMFSYPFVFSTLDVQFPNKLSVIVYNLGSLLVLVLGFVLDVGSPLRRRRGQYGFAIASLLTVVAVVHLVVLSTRHVDMNQLMRYDPQQGAPINAYLLNRYTGLFYSCCLFVGMAISCVFLFTGWIIGSLSNDIGATARFSGTFFAVQAVGLLVSLQSSKHSLFSIPSNTPLYVGIGLLVISLAFLYYVVCQIADTNNWSLANFGNEAAHVAHVEESHCLQQQTSGVALVDRSSTAKDEIV
ncbi:hypothetical protein GQ54DRAFT_111109 [Martensiomyces pterosporus]|nr:hypothetical protein GQ54DRAFT_111109 [Martensiomyces pterosporus]